jgi:hypothetical protein
VVFATPSAMVFVPGQVIEAQMKLTSLGSSDTAKGEKQTKATFCSRTAKKIVAYSWEGSINLEWSFSKPSTAV